MKYQWESPPPPFESLEVEGRNECNKETKYGQAQDEGEREIEEEAEEEEEEEEQEQRRRM